MTRHIKSLRRKLRNYFMTSGVSVSILYYFYKIMCGSLRYTQDRTPIKEQDQRALDKRNGKNLDEAKPIIFCLWHDELFPLMQVKRDLDVVCIVSSSKDGTILNNLLSRLGTHTVAGSSRRDGLKALLSTVRMMKQEGMHTCITVDGPMGPRHKTKDGAFLLAQKANARIIPVRLFMHNSFKMPSWDKFQIPLPFSKVDVLLSDGFFVTEELTKENLSMYREKLEREFENLAPYKD